MLSRIAAISGLYDAIVGALLICVPGWLAATAKVLPMGWLVQGLKDVMVRGQGPQAALLPMLILVAFAAVVTVIAARLFKWDTA